MVRRRRASNSNKSNKMVRGNGNNKKPAKTGPKPVFLGRLHEVTQFALLGATNRDFANLFSVSIQTIDYWMRNYPEFRDAKEAGSMPADARVAECMYLRAVGYDYQEKEYQVVVDKDTGEEYRMLKKITTKHIPADVKAGFKWLAARRRDGIWTEAGYMRVHHTHEGRINHLHVAAEDLDMEQLSDAAREVLFELNMEQLEQGKRQN